MRDEFDFSNRDLHGIPSQGNDPVYGHLVSARWLYITGYFFMVTSPFVGFLLTGSIAQGDQRGDLCFLLAVWSYHTSIMFSTGRWCANASWALRTGRKPSKASAPAGLLVGFGPLYLAAGLLLLSTGLASLLSVNSDIAARHRAFFEIILGLSLAAPAALGITAGTIAILALRTRDKWKRDEELPPRLSPGRRRERDQREEEDRGEKERREEARRRRPPPRDDEDY